MTNNLKPIAEIPKHIYDQLWGGLDEDGLEVCFWEDDDEASLDLYLSLDEIQELEEDYGIDDNLIDWMRDQKMHETDFSANEDHNLDNYETFIINDKVVSQYQFVMSDRHL